MKPSIKIADYLTVRVTFAPGRTPAIEDQDFEDALTLMSLDPTFGCEVDEAARRWTTVAIRLPDRSPEIVGGIDR